MPKITHIETTPFKLPMRGALRWGKTSHMSELAHLLVRVITDSGHSGLAEAPPRPTIYGETLDSMQAIIAQHLAPAIIGLDVADIAEINRRMEPVKFNFAAKGAIDMAVHEALAASKGISLLELLKPVHKKVKASYILGMDSPETMLAEAKAVYEQGLRVLKVKVGRNFEADLALLEALQREFANSGLVLYADANQTLLPEEAQSRLRQLAEKGILYVEEPLPIHAVSARSALRQSQILPLIADDSAFTPPDPSRELELDTFDILNIKTPRAGFYHSQKMLKQARAQGKGVMVGSNASSTLGAVHTAIFSGLEGIDYPCELSFFLKLEDEIVTRPMKIIDGFVELDSLADIKLDEERFKKFALAE